MTQLERIQLQFADKKNVSVYLGVLDDADKYFKRAISISEEGFKLAEKAKVAFKGANHDFELSINVLEKGLQQAKELGASDLEKKILNDLNRAKLYSKSALQNSNKMNF